MKKIMIGIIVGVLLTLAAVMVFAEAPEVSVDVPFSSGYAWRGQSFDKNPVIQPSVWLGYSGFSLEFWHNYSTRDGKVDEFDTTLGYERAWGIATFNVGFTSYDYPNGDPSTCEGTLGVSVEGPVTVFANGYYDFDEVEAFYGELGVSKSVELLDKKLSLDIEARVGASDGAYNQYWFDMPRDGTMQDGTITLALPWSVTDQFMITPSVQYSYMLDEQVRNAVQDDSVWVGTLALSYTF